MQQPSRAIKLASMSAAAPTPPSSPEDLVRNPRHVAIVAFAEAHAALGGENPLADFPRLVTEASETAGVTVRWQAQGRTVAAHGGPAQIWLDLQASTVLPTICQRCLQTMTQTVSFNRAFRFVHDEATAQQLDDEVEEDVLVYSKQFDLLALVEDELLMAMPIAPRHESCPQAPVLHVQSDDFPAQPQAQPHPFAALQALKKKP